MNQWRRNSTSVRSLAFLSAIFAFTGSAAAAGDFQADCAAMARDFAGSGRIVTAEELASVAVFLVSPRAIGINGETIAVTGGEGTTVHN